MAKHGQSQVPILGPECLLQGQKQKRRTCLLGDPPKKGGGVHVTTKVMPSRLPHATEVGCIKGQNGGIPLSKQRKVGGVHVFWRRSRVVFHLAASCVYFFSCRLCKKKRVNHVHFFSGCRSRNQKQSRNVFLAWVACHSLSKKNSMLRQKKCAHHLQFNKKQGTYAQLPPATQNTQEHARARKKLATLLTLDMVLQCHTFCGQVRGSIYGLHFMSGDTHHEAQCPITQAEFAHTRTMHRPIIALQVHPFPWVCKACTPTGKACSAQQRMRRQGKRHCTLCALIENNWTRKYCRKWGMSLDRQ